MSFKPKREPSSSGQLVLFHYYWSYFACIKENHFAVVRDINNTNTTADATALKAMLLLLQRVGVI